MSYLLGLPTHFIAITQDELGRPMLAALDAMIKMWHHGSLKYDPLEASRLFINKFQRLWQEHILGGRQRRLGEMCFVPHAADRGLVWMTSTFVLGCRVGRCWTGRCAGRFGDAQFSPQHIIAWIRNAA